MLLDSPPTPFDLRFRLGPFPVRVHPLFWLGMALIGRGAFEAGMQFGLLWVACGFVSILWHELGHALAMRHYRSPARIELTAFGGLAIPAYPSPSAWRRMAIAAAGPAAGFLLFLSVWGSNELLGWSGKNVYLLVLYSFLFQINLYWTLLNLLPIWPLDGSRIFREAAAVSGHRQPDLLTLRVSLGLAVGLGVVGLVMNFGPLEWKRQVVETWPGWLLWLIPEPVMTFFLFLLAFQSYTAMQQFRRPRLYNEDRLPWERR